MDDPITRPRQPRGHLRSAGRGLAMTTLAVVLCAGGWPPAAPVVRDLAKDAAPAGVSATKHGEQPWSGTRGAITARQRASHADAIGRAIWRAAVRAKVDPRLAVSLAHVESNLDHSKVSRGGARGVMQLMPATAARLGVDPRNLKQNIRGGVTYLRQMLDRFAGNEVLAVAAYNAGPTQVMRARGVPNIPETRAHVAKVRAQKLLATLTSPPPLSRL